MSQSFDLIVIGTGSAGSTVAHRCRQAGWSVAIVDSRPFGGTCALRGCDPKKVLVGAAHAADWVRRLQTEGIFTSDIHLDWPALMRFKRTFTDPVPANRLQSFRKAGIEPFQGRARFVDETAVQVGGETLQGRHVVIAAGARPATLGIPGEEHLATSTDFLALEHLPPRIIFVGGGYISFEFAHVAARAGAAVRILQRGEQPLKGFEPDLVARLVASSRNQGMEIHLHSEVQAIEKRGDEYVVLVRQEGTERTFQADLVVHGAGRVAEIDDLNLEAAGVAWERRGVTVNEYLQSVSNPAVYAAGDAAASGPPLTPVAGMEGGIVARNLLEGNRHTPRYQGIPSVVFTIPPLAGVGLTEPAARAQGHRFQVKQEDTSSWYSSRRVKLKETGFKVLLEEGSERILGAHLLGPEADEAINLFALAMRQELPASALREQIYAYPTAASDISYMVS
ncbi:MAG: hypothetical protein KatS3mg050_3056 [Litorilinea sp.]|nr:MAG: hypothetical protein KatS3mg050_3056 [Litorilinea sp.]